ncbi:MAG: hypothetical protein OXF02_05455 [Simkaniaceae bacterium]|nr:hypothetical protein [Simkaniaceae bacterium]
MAALAWIWYAIKTLIHRMTTNNVVEHMTWTHNMGQTILHQEAGGNREIEALLQEQRSRQIENTKRTSQIIENNIRRSLRVALDVTPVCLSIKTKGDHLRTYITGVKGDHSCTHEDERPSLQKYAADIEEIRTKITHYDSVYQSSPTKDRTETIVNHLELYQEKLKNIAYYVKEERIKIRNMFDQFQKESQTEIQQSKETGLAIIKEFQQQTIQEIEAERTHIVGQERDIAERIRQLRADQWAAYNEQVSPSAWKQVTNNPIEAQILANRCHPIYRNFAEKSAEAVHEANVRHLQEIDETVDVCVHNICAALSQEYARNQERLSQEYHSVNESVTPLVKQDEHLFNTLSTLCDEELSRITKLLECFQNLDADHAS